MEKKVEILTLKSLNEKEYLDKDVECLFIDDMPNFVNEYVEELTRHGIELQQAQKTVKVKARLGVVGEQVDTRPRVERDGKIYTIGETKGTVKVEGSMIVTNPDGEEYIVKPDVFDKKYSATKEEGVYIPKTQPVQYFITDVDVAFTAPWGEKMFATKGSAIIVASPTDVYAVTNEAFNKTYTPIVEQKKDIERNM